MASDEDGDEEFLYSDDEMAGAEDEGVDWEDVAPPQAASAAAPVALTGPEAPREDQNGADTTAHGENEDADVAAQQECGSDEDEYMWEDVSQDDADLEPSVPDEAATSENGAAATDLARVDWAQINQSLEQEARAAAVAAEKKRKRRRAVRMTKEDKLNERALHQSHLLVLLALHLEFNSQSRSPLLQGLLLSLTAGEAFDFFADLKLHPLNYSMEMLVRWFNREFRVSTAAAAHHDMSKPLLTESRLLEIFFDRKGTEYELAVLFTTLCRSLRLHCRYVCALDPLVVRNGSAFFETTATTLSNARPSPKQRRQRQQKQSKRLRTALSTESTGDAEDAEEVGEEERNRQFYWIWTEVLDERSKLWMQVDCVRKLVNQPRKIEPLRGKSIPFAYVVAIYESGRVLDVTPRYASTWSKTLPLRLSDGWVENVINDVNRSVEGAAASQGPDPDQTTSSMAFAEIEILLAEEINRLRAMKMSEAMPTSLEAFKKHHLYCLERHLGRFECVHPRKAVGIFSGQPVFLRSSVHRVQSAFKWRRLGREVMESERATPARWYSPNNRKRPGDGDQYGDDDCNDEPLDADDLGASRGRSGLALFGIWQTTEIVPPAVVDGVLPKNKYGNIEVWSPAHVPVGAVHLRLPRIEQVAKQLGVDYAQAVVGFERQGPMGRTAPQVDGIVVAAAHEATLVDAHAYMQQAAIEKAIEKNRRLAAKRWERLAKRLLLRQRLDDDYGKV